MSATRLSAALNLDMLSARCDRRSNGEPGVCGCWLAASRACLRWARSCAMSRSACSKAGQLLAWSAVSSRPALSAAMRASVKCGPVFGTQMMMAVFETRAAIALRTVPTLLRVHNRRAGDGKDGRRGDHWLEHVLLLRDQGAQIKRRSSRRDKLKFGQVNDCSRLHLRNIVIIRARCYEINRHASVLQQFILCR